MHKTPQLVLFFSDVIILKRTVKDAALLISMCATLTVHLDSNHGGEALWASGCSVRRRPSCWNITYGSSEVLRFALAF